MLNIATHIILTASLLLITSTVYCKEKSAYQINKTRDEVSNIGKSFIRAHHENSMILFAPAPNLDWETLAPKYLTAINIANPTKWELNSLLYNSNEVTHTAEFPFESILDEKISSWHWYLISTNGIDELQLSRLRGVVSFKIDPASRNIIRRDCYGYVLGFRKGPSANWDSGGFVIKSKERLTWQLDTAREGRQKFVHDLSKQQPLPGQHVERDEDRIIDMKYQFKLTNDGPSFTFVSYKENMKSPTCKYRFQLLLTESMEQPVAENYYGCDI